MSKTVKNNFICFIGIDGSGKTTLAKTLAKMMEENGITSKYVWNRFELSIMLRPFLIIGRTLFLHGKDMFDDYAEYSDSKKRLFKNRFLSTVYQYVVLLDYSLQIFLKIKVPLIFGKNIICDRYIYDTIVDLKVDLHYHDTKIKNILKILFHLLPKPDLLFLIDVPEDIAYQRKDDTPSIEYLRERRNVYLNIGKGYDAVILDGTKKLEKLQSEIEMRVFQ